MKKLLLALSLCLALLFGVTSIPYHPTSVAVAAGSTYDQIQAAIDLLPVTGGEVVLGDGVSVMDNPVTLRSNVRLIGVGNGTVLQQNFTPTIENLGIIMLPAGGSNMEVRNMKLDGQNMAGALWWFHGAIATPHSPIGTVSQVIVDNIEAVDFDRGVTLYTNSGAAVSNSRFFDITYEAINFDHGNNDVLQSAELNKAFNNYISGAKIGIMVDNSYPDGYQRGAEIFSNVVEDTYIGILAKAPFTSSHDNIINRAEGVGLFLGSYTSSSHDTIIASGSNEGAGASVRLNGTGISVDYPTVIASFGIGLDVGRSSFSRVAYGRFFGGYVYPIDGRYSGGGMEYIGNTLYSPAGDMRISGDRVRAADTRFIRSVWSTTAASPATSGSSVLALSSVMGIYLGVAVSIQTDSGTQSNMILDIYNNQVRLAIPLSGNVMTGNSVTSHPMADYPRIIQQYAPISNQMVTGTLSSGY